MELTNKIINSFLALSAAAALGAGGMYLYHRDTIKGGNDYQLIKECETILSEHGRDFPDDVTKEEAALKGYLAAYNDKYTAYLKSNGSDDYLSEINNFSCLLSCGYRVGLGDNGDLVITDVEKDSPAEKQGLAAGDVILAADSKSVAAEGVNNVAWELLGKDGTTMHLVIMRDGLKKELDFVRANDPDKTVDNVKTTPYGDILYSRIMNMDSSAYAIFTYALEDHAKECKKLIIDLRNNPGGVTDSALKIADNFLSIGSVTQHYYKGNEDVMSLNNDGNEIELPIVVLVNEKTASAAEILTALLKQYGKDVTIVGTNTFGKGIFQLEETLSNGGVLHYTAGYYTVGDWECYQDKGIKPDVEVEMDRTLIGTDDDVQLKKALELLA